MKEEGYSWSLKMVWHENLPEANGSQHKLDKEKKIPNTDKNYADEKWQENFITDKDKLAGKIQ